MTGIKKLDKALSRWLKVASEAKWRHFPDVKQSWPSADYVKPDTVFDILGNQYRLITRINYGAGVVSIQDVKDHADYDDWSR